jgi:hypothetical protein
MQCIKDRRGPRDKGGAFYSRLYARTSFQPKNNPKGLIILFLLAVPGSP